MLPESAVIAEYLDERYPEPPLWPEDAGERAVGRLLVFRFDDFSRPYYALRCGGARAVRGRARRSRPPARGPELALRARVRLADVAFLPWVLRSVDVLGISLDPWPALAAWVERACERPVAAERALVAAL